MAQPNFREQFLPTAEIAFLTRYRRWTELVEASDDPDDHRKHAEYTGKILGLEVKEKAAFDALPTVIVNLVNGNMTATVVPAEKVEALPTIDADELPAPPAGRLTGINAEVLNDYV